MAASLIQPYVDKENAPAAGARKGRIASLGARPTIGKTFGGEKPQTPRQVLGNISNDRSAHRNVLQGKQLSQGRQPFMKKPDPLQPFKQPNLLLKKPVGLSMRKSSTTNTPRQKKQTTNMAPSLFKLPSRLLSDNLPPMEQMHIFEDNFDGMNGLPVEHCLSAHLGKLRPLMPPVSRKMTPSVPPFDISSFTFEDALRPLFQDENIPLPELDSCLNMPPMESLDFLDINKIKLWDDEN